MCGVFAVFSPNEAIDQNPVIAGTRALRHRWPDGEGLYFHPRGDVALGHRRLAIIDPENGKQPITNEDGSIVAVVNGEFYDHETQRRNLQDRGHYFRTGSDSEVIVHLYEEHGFECLQYLQGEFAFVLWDENRRQLFAARDRFGVKPLVYSQNASRLSLASEAKALFAAGVTAEWDAESFFFASNLQYLPTNRTLFNNVSALPPSHFLTATADVVRIQRYWELPVASQPSIDSAASVDLKDIVEQCRQHLIDAVKCRLRSDVPICAHLSGGIDSSSVAGIASAILSRPIDTFNIGFDTDIYDESSIAIGSSSELKSKLHSIRVNSEDVLQTMPAAVAASEGLAINGHLSAKYLLHQAMRERGFAVTLTGEGADEVFFGYAHLRTDWNQSGKPDASTVVASNQTSIGMMLPHGQSLSLTGVHRRLGFVPAWMRAKATLGWKIHQLMHSDVLSSLGNRDAFCEVADQVLANTAFTANVATSRKLWTRLAMSGYILRTLGDGTEMPHSIEGRVPFLDHRLWEFLRNVSLEQQLSGPLEKTILRAAVKPFVTAKVHQRPKHPLDAPPVLMCGSASTDGHVRDYLHSDAMRSQPFFCVRKIEQVLDQLQTAPDIERQAWDPALMMAMSAIEINRLISKSRTANCSTEGRQ